VALNFAYLLTLISQTCSRAVRVLLTLYALELGAKPYVIGGLAATFAILPMFLSWPVGRMSDKYGPRWLLAFGSVAGASGMLVAWLWPGMPALFVAAAMNGLLVGFFNVSLQNLVGVLSTPESRAKNYSNFSLMNSTASFVGPLLVGFAIEHAGHATTSLYLVGLSVVPAFLLVGWGGVFPKGSRGKARGGGGGGLRVLLADRAVWRVLLISSMVQSGLDMFNFYMPVYAHDIGLSASVIGILVATFSAAGFVARFSLPRLLARHNEADVLMWAFYLSAAAFLLVPFFQSAVIIGIISFAFGLGNGCGQPITMTLTFSHSTDGRSGEALGLRSTVNHFTRLVAPAVFGYVATIATLSVVFWMNAAMLGWGGVLSRRERGAQH
jgi:MFS family permease